MFYGRMPYQLDQLGGLYYRQNVPQIPLFDQLFALTSIGLASVFLLLFNIALMSIVMKGAPKNAI